MQITIASITESGQKFHVCVRAFNEILGIDHLPIELNHCIEVNYCVAVIHYRQTMILFLTVRIAFSLCITDCCFYLTVCSFNTHSVCIDFLHIQTGRRLGKHHPLVTKINRAGNLRFSLSVLSFPLCVIIFCFHFLFSLSVFFLFALCSHFLLSGFI